MESARVALSWESGRELGAEADDRVSSNSGVSWTELKSPALGAKHQWHRGRGAGSRLYRNNSV